MSSGLLRVRRYSYWHLLSKEGSNCYQFSRARYHPVVSKYAELLGFKGIRVNDPKDIDASWDEAFAADRPVVLSVKTDPNTPPLTAHITLEQESG